MEVDSMGIKKSFGASILALTVMFGGVSQAQAKSVDVEVEAWEDAVTVYGKYLETDEVNREVTNDLLGYEETDEIGYVGAVDTYEFIGLNSTDESLKSSIRIKRTPEGTGLNLEISEEGGDISKVTEEMFKNALTTSGFHDAEVTIASFQDVTGESALSGVFKAQEIKGEEVDTERTGLAQEELNTVVEINEENEGQEGFTQEQLNKAIAEVKTKVSEEGGELTEERVREIVDEQLEANGLSEHMNQESRDRIVGFITKAQDMGIFSGDSANKFIEGGKNLVKDITDSDGFKDASGKIKDTVTDEGFWSKIGDFFKGIFDAIGGLFGGGEEDPNQITEPDSVEDGSNK